MKSAWKQVTLGEVCGIPSKLVDPRLPAFMDLLHVGAGNMETGNGKLKGLLSASEEGLISGKFLFDEKAVLYSKIRPYLMKVARPEFSGLCSADVYPLEPALNHINRDFLYHLLLTPGFTDYAVEGSARAGMPKVNREHLFAFEFLLPPIQEQQRIVTILDEAFEGIATAKANAEKNLQNAREVSESHLQSVFTQSGVGWRERKLGDLIEIQNGFAFKSNDYSESGYFVMRISNVQDGEITLENPRYIQLADPKLNRFILNEGDILVSLTGNIGRVGVIEKAHLPAVLNQRVARITVKDRDTNRDFIFRFLSSRTFRDELQEAGHGAAQQNVSTKEIETVKICMPKMEEQMRVIASFDEVSSEIGRLEIIYEQKLTTLNELKQSLLHRAFNGDL